MEIFNKYIKANQTSEIAFIRVPHGINTKNLYYVRFDKDYGYNDGFYLDKNDRLVRLIWDKNTTGINNISHITKYYTFIKVIKHDNPDIIGKTMIFTFGRQIYNKLINDNDFTRKVFLLKSSKIENFITYEDSRFIDTDMDLEDDNLDINNFVNIPTLDLDLIERNRLLKKKLKYLSENTKLKNDILNILETDMSNTDKVDKIINIIPLENLENE